MNKQIKRINLIISILEEEEERLQVMYPEGMEGTVHLKILSLKNKLLTVLWKLDQNAMSLEQAEKLTNNVVVDTNKICEGCILEDALHIII